MGTGRVRVSGRVLLTSSIAVIAVGWSVGTASANPTTERVSDTTTGTAGMFRAEFPAVSPNGRFVVFRTVSPLVPDDTNRDTDVYLRDRQAGTIELVSRTNSGGLGNGRSGGGKSAVSPDGRYVAFDSQASNLVAGDTNGFNDIFVRDRVARTTKRVNLSTYGAQADNYSFTPSISADGRYVAFDSIATTLVPGDTNGKGDVFRRDLATGVTVRVSVGYGGQQASDQSFGPSISTDGQYVAFTSYAPNLVAGDTNASEDVFVAQVGGALTRVSLDGAGLQFPRGGFASYLAGVTISADARSVVFEATNPAGNPTIYVRDRIAGRTEVASVSSSGAPAASMSTRATISGSGRYVAFESFSSNLVPGDTNGQSDIFVHDRLTGATTRANVSSQGVQDNYISFAPAAADTGTAFMSGGSTLVPGGMLGNQQIYFRSF
jgi:Tol biopolymer transport system component